jgi:hypothetical protein
MTNPTDRLYHLHHARVALRTARDHVRQAASTRALDAIRRAEKSLGGAIRHAERMIDKQARLNNPPLDATEALRQLQDLLDVDGREWDADTIAQVAETVRAAGYSVEEPE